MKILPKRLQIKKILTSFTENMTTEENIYPLEPTTYDTIYVVAEMIATAFVWISLMISLALFIYFMIKRYRNRQFRAKLRGLRLFNCVCWYININIHLDICFCYFIANFSASKRTNYQSVPNANGDEKSIATPMYVVYPPANLQNKW